MFCVEPDGTEMSFLVEGMDRGPCVCRVEHMVGRLPGAADIGTSFFRQSLQLDRSRTPRDLLETNLRALGYRPSALTTAVHAQPVSPGEQGQPVPFRSSVAGQHDAGAVSRSAWHATVEGRVVAFRKVGRVAYHGLLYTHVTTLTHARE